MNDCKWIHVWMYEWLPQPDLVLDRRCLSVLLIFVPANIVKVVMSKWVFAECHMVTQTLLEKKKRSYNYCLPAWDLVEQLSTLKKIIIIILNYSVLMMCWNGSECLEDKWRWWSNVHTGCLWAVSLDMTIQSQGVALVSQAQKQCQGIQR